MKMILKMLNVGMINNILNISTGLLGVSVTLGWFLNIDFLIRIYTELCSMKITTAISFILVAIIYGITYKQDTSIGFKWREPLAIICLAYLIALMPLQLTTEFLDYDTNIHNIIIQEQPEKAYMSFKPGLPSIGVMFAFSLVCIDAAMWIFKRQHHKLIGCFVVGIGVLAILGYLLNIPTLYWYFSWSSAIAAHTAIGLVLIGLTIITLPNKAKNDPS